MNEKTLGEHLQQARRTAGITQQQLCQRAGLSYSTLAKIERGAIKSPSIFTIQQIASVLGLTLDQLIGAVTPAQGQTNKKRSKSGITFVYFDVNGCLVRFFHRAFTKMALETGTSSDLIETAFWHYNDAVCSGKMTVEEFNQALAKRLGIPSVDWENYYLEAIDPITEMHDLVRWAAEHYKVGLLTNIMPDFVSAMKERGLLPDVPYSSIIDSSEVGYIKPEIEIYEIAQDKAGCPANEILLVDDSRTNIMAAERLGWHVLWFDDYMPDESVKRVKTALEIA